jgi:hypothetical protein
LQGIVSASINYLVKKIKLHYASTNEQSSTTLSATDSTNLILHVINHAFWLSVTKPAKEAAFKQVNLKVRHTAQHKRMVNSDYKEQIWKKNRQYS